MLTDRYPYSPIIRRKPFRWPNGARIALMVAPNIECFHIDKVIPGALSSYLPDVTGYALRDYGARIGVFRLMEVLDKHTIRASVLLNADVCVHYPAIIEEGNRRNWEWLGHGVTNNIRMTQYAADEERAVVRQIRETITAVTGKAPRGWLGPGAAMKARIRLIISQRRGSNTYATGVSTTNRWRCVSSPDAWSQYRTNKASMTFGSYFRAATLPRTGVRWFAISSTRSMPKARSRGA